MVNSAACDCWWLKLCASGDITLYDLDFLAQSNLSFLRPTMESLLHQTIFHATCLAILLQYNLHKELPSVMPQCWYDFLKANSIFYKASCTKH